MKKFISCMVMLAMCISMFTGMINASELKFTDVSESDWYYNDVKTAVEMSLVNGKSETTYAPNDNLTYAEAIKLAACMHQLYNEGAVSFGTGDPWYQPYLDYCVKNKIIDKEYDYNAKATRAGYMGIFANALPEDGLKGINNVPDDSIPDVPSARAYAAGVYKLYRAGILTGVDAAHNCNPLANITRAEVAAILTRMMNADKRVKFDMGTGSTSNSGSSSSGSSSGGSSSGGSSSGGSKETSALKIKTDPKDVTVKVGNKAVFTVAAKGGTKPYSYQWMVLNEKDADPLEDEDEFIKGANTDELTLIPDEESETEVYCVITDAEGEEVESDIATLYCVKDTEEGKEEATGLRIKTQPKSQTVGAKEAALFTVEVEGGKEPYTYQWQVVESGSWKNIVTSAFYNGVTTKTLKAIYTYDKEEHIRCVITDANGDTVETEKVTFLVELNLALAIKTQPESVSATADTEVTFTVEVSGGKAPYTYKWQTNRNGGNFYDINSGTFNFHEGHDAATYELKISQTVLDNKHGFRCIITDANGDSVTSEAAAVTYEEELDNDDFEMTISEVIFINGRGIALTGKITEGKVNVGDTVYINDTDDVRIAKTTVKGIEISNKALDEAKKGQTVGILVDLDVEEYKGKIVVGNILSASGGSLGERPAVSRPSTVTRPTVKMELAITSQSEDMTGSIGIFDLSVEVSGGTAPYTYVWMKSKVVGNRNGTFTTKFIAISDTEGKISGAKTANLKVSLTTLDTHEYMCVVTDADGNQVTSEVITITVDSESSSGRVSIPTSGKTGNLD